MPSLDADQLQSCPLFVFTHYCGKKIILLRLEILVKMEASYYLCNKIFRICSLQQYDNDLYKLSSSIFRDNLFDLVLTMKLPPRNPPLLCDREADAALESAVHKWPLLILGVISVCCGLLYLGLYFWLTVPENADLMEALSTGFARSTGFGGAEGRAEGSSKGDALNDDFASAQTAPV